MRALHVYTCVACSVGSAHWVHFATARQLAHHREHCSWQDACSVVGVVVMIGSQLHNGMQQWGVRHGASCFCWPQVHGENWHGGGADLCTRVQPPVICRGGTDL